MALTLKPIWILKSMAGTLTWMKIYGINIKICGPNIKMYDSNIKIHENLGHGY